MRRVVLKMSLSLDGYICDENGTLSWAVQTFKDRELTGWLLDTLWAADVHIMGSNAYRVMATYWKTGKGVFADPMKSIPWIVFSRNRDRQENGSLVMDGNLHKNIMQLKQKPGKDILAHGGATFARELIELGLIDEFRLIVHPVILGTGISLFSGIHTPVKMKLLSIHSFKNGAVSYVYEPEKAIESIIPERT